MRMRGRWDVSRCALWVCIVPFSAPVSQEQTAYVSLLQAGLSQRLPVEEYVEGHANASGLHSIGTPRCSQP